MRLHVMMFLEYGIKAFWYPLASYFLTASAAQGGLGFTQDQKGWIIAVPMAIGALAGPLLIGPLADRYVSTEKCLGVLLLLAGIVKFVTAYQSSFAAWMVLSTIYGMLYVPTISLTNSLAMSHLPDPKQQFPRVRVWGTISWIIVSWGFAIIWLQTDRHWQWLPPFLKGGDVENVNERMLDGLKAAGVCAIALSAYCFFVLPKTPPDPEIARGKKLSWSDGRQMLTQPSFVVLLLLTVVVGVLHSLYFIQVGGFLKARGLAASNLLPAMSIGQFSEILVLALLGPALVRFGFRWVMTFGVFCYGARFAVFAIDGLPISAYVGAQALHGFCFACYIAAGFMYVESIAPRRMHYTAQTMFVLMLMGVAPGLAVFANTHIAARFVDEDGILNAVGYAGYWQTTAIMALVALGLFVAFFRDESESQR
jgi:MFS family permease